MHEYIFLFSDPARVQHLPAVEQPVLEPLLSLPVATASAVVIIPTLKLAKQAIVSHWADTFVLAKYPLAL